jgi:hypothetical protein
MEKFNKLGFESFPKNEDYTFSHFTPITSLKAILKSGYIKPSEQTKNINYAILKDTFFGFVTPKNKLYMTKFSSNQVFLLFDPIIYYKYKGFLSHNWNFGESRENIRYSEPRTLKGLTLTEKLRLNLNYADIYIGSSEVNPEKLFLIYTRYQSNSNELVINGSVSLKYLKAIVVSDSIRNDVENIVNEPGMEKYKNLIVSVSDNNSEIVQKFLNRKYLFDEPKKGMEIHSLLVNY